MKRNIFENFIIAAIILVIIQTFLDDYSSFILMSVSFRHYLLYTSFLFDLTFTIEFIIRCTWAKKENGIKNYIMYQRGWIDFLASIPLLVLNSGPTLYFFLKGDLTAASTAVGIYNVLKVVKAIRIVRILRLIRVLKIFGKIHNADSKMAQRHIAAIATTTVFTIIVILITFSILRITKFDYLKDQRMDQYTRMVENIDDVNKTLDVPLRPLIFKLMSNDNNILKMYYSDFLVFSNISDAVFQNNYNYDDYFIVDKDDYKVFVSLTDLNKAIAAMNIQNFLIILFLIIVYMIIYTRHFVQTISDVIHIMERGFREKDYNLEVKINEAFKDDEVFKLAKEYNENYLPLKAKLQQEEKEKKATVLSMDDLLNFGKK